MAWRLTAGLFLMDCRCGEAQPLSGGAVAPLCIAAAMRPPFAVADYGRCRIVSEQLWRRDKDLMTNRMKTVLVVEDNLDDVALLQLAARRTPAGIAFHSVQSGEQAIAYLRGEGQFADRQAHPFPDLVLLDLCLPGMDGFDVLAWIRNHPELKDLKVFIWTDLGHRETLERAHLAGANRFVPKSVAFVRGGLAGLVTDMSQAIPAFDRGGGSLSGEQPNRTLPA